MFKIKQLTMLTFLLASLFTLSANAKVAVSELGVSGYDLVSYHQDSGPIRGDGQYQSDYKGVSYLFANKANKKTFDKNPEKYLPAYGGFCAYGVALGKKFHVDPLAWKVVDGTLYLNLNKKFQEKWLAKEAKYIVDANNNWPEIQNTPASEL